MDSLVKLREVQLVAREGSAKEVVVGGHTGMPVSTDDEDLTDVC